MEAGQVIRRDVPATFEKLRHHRYDNDADRERPAKFRPARVTKRLRRLLDGEPNMTKQAHAEKTRDL